jgi:hypothetical protein
MLDHINRDPRDCRIENLRVCNNAQNQYNIAKRRHNTSGFKGVVFHPKCPRKPWQAKIVTEDELRVSGISQQKNWQQWLTPKARSFTRESLPAHSEVTPMSFKYRDSPLYYRTAREALRLEQSGEYDRAAKVWAKANRESRNELNQDWSERRSDFCLMQNMREKRKEVDDA